jgi:hypothetical protein
MKLINSKTGKTNGANPTTWYKKNVLFENSMFNVLLSSDRGGGTLEHDPLVPNEEENQHDISKFPTNDP